MSQDTQTVKDTITLTPETAQALGWWAKLTGLSLSEIAEYVLTREFENFTDENDDSYPEESIGTWKFHSRADARRALAWVKKRTRGDSTGKYPIFRSEISELADGRFQIDAFKTENPRWGKGEVRVC